MGCALVRLRVRSEREEDAVEDLATQIHRDEIIYRNEKGKQTAMKERVTRR